MAPGPPKRGNPKAKSKKALSVDFKKVKTKVGRKLAPAKNSTKIDFQARGIVVPGQSVAQDKSGLAVNQRKQTLKELLAQTTHYSERTRKDALMGLKDLFGRHQKELVMHAVVVIEKLFPRVTDTDKNVRQAFVALLRTSILPHLPQTMMKPLIPVIMAHVCSAMTHLVIDIRVSACSFLELLMQHCSNLILPFFSDQIVQHYVSLLGKGGIAGQSESRLVNVLGSLEHFLSALKRNTVSLPSGASCATHTWGAQLNLNHQALHAYKSAVPEGNHTLGLFAQESQWHQSSKQETPSKGVSKTQPSTTPTKSVQRIQNTGVLGQVPYAATPLVAVLLDCWAEWCPLVKGPNPDATSLECLVIITRCLCHIFQTITSEAASNSSSKDVSSTTPLSVPDHGSEEWETHLCMQQQFLPALCRHLLGSFPCTAPAVRLTPKVEEGLVALNMGVCEVLLQFFPTSFLETKDTFVNVVLQCIADALHGTMLPASEYSSGFSDPKLAEIHCKYLVQYIPGLVTCVPSDWVSPLLEAFTHVFKSCNSRSNLKLVCLSSMSEVLLPGRNSGGKRKLQQTLVPVEYQSQWLESLPKLLWELKSSHPNISQAVLEMLLHLGRSSPDGSPLAERYTGLQQAMVPFFCTFLKQRDESRCLYGPFINLPKPCQELATDLLFYYTSFSPLFLKVLAQCCLCPELDVSVAVRIVEVLQQAFCKGAVELSEHLSFLLTLLMGRLTSQTGRTKKKPQAETEAGATGSGERQADSRLEIQKRHNVLVGVVCACLAQLGDGHVLLQLIGPSIRQELEEQTRLDVVQGLFRVVAVLSHKDQDSDGVFLPEPLKDLFPKTAADFLISVALMHDINGGSGNLLLCSSAKRPCMMLMTKSPKFTRAVLKFLHEVLLKEVNSPSLKIQKERVAAAQVILEMLKTEKLDRCLSSAKDLFKAVLKTLEQLVLKVFEVDGGIHSSEGRDLKRLHEQLLTATNAQFGSEFAAS
ncbi:pre-rRNA-processing protein IPI1 [Marchantia polymorpha subsp. ruderalis]|uniref:Uncharacterized protein n=1 Tax=Marchantia polymorpha TaxID=3197 RepID=A0A2R6XCE5_MARPO|nr:hypothetical protein MARPO_0023s0084 [Marchantia polymorpha]BBN01905.1 hypothetical protein Mp_2g11160 [Marchantia polymorpha subsp. ruderalis]|eukprot:PTQ43768.1 hypothetical protein MARPO_0023s0084 [Marchantia polymorpha]